jgi:xylulokinase
MDVTSRTWAPAMLSCPPLQPADLRKRLGAEPVPSHQVVGEASQLLVDRWGIAPGTAIVAASGDNPCAIAGLGLAQPGDLALSLGTSDTLLGVAPANKATPATEGHIMAHPTDPTSVFGMLCYKNGGAARQAVRDTHAGGTWPTFDAALQSTPKGNGGILGLHLPLEEITPIINRAGIWHVDAEDAPLDAAKLTDAQAVRAVVEGRFLSMRARGGAIGLRDATRILATGGGSQSKEILQVCADVFNAQVLADDTPDAAAVGAARRAAHAHVLAAEHGGATDGLPYDAFLRTRLDAQKLEVVAEPSADAAEVYDDELVARYRALEDAVAAGEM